MSGPIVFPPHSELTTGWGVFSCCTSSSLSLPSSFSLSVSKTYFSESSFITYGSSRKICPFFSHYRFHFLCSKPYGRWHPLAPLCAPSFPPNPLATPPPPLHPHSFSFVRHHIRIYKSQPTTAHSPKTFIQVTPGRSATFQWSRDV